MSVSPLTQDQLDKIRLETLDLEPQQILATFDALSQQLLALTPGGPEFMRPSGAVDTDQCLRFITADRGSSLKYAAAQVGIQRQLVTASALADPKAAPVVVSCPVCGQRDDGKAKCTMTGCPIGATP